jgi:hypothetical protein
MTADGLAAFGAPTEAHACRRAWLPVTEREAVDLYACQHSVNNDLSQQTDTC